MAEVHFIIYPLAISSRVPFVLFLVLSVGIAELIHFCRNQVIIISIRDGIVHFVGDPADVDGVVEMLLDDY